MSAWETTDDLFSISSYSSLPDETFSDLICLLLRGMNLPAENLDEENWDEDAGLVRRLKDGDKDAFAHLVNKYQRDMYSICYSKLWNKADAEDAAAEAFKRSLEKIATLRDDRRYFGWLVKIAKNCCNDILKRRIRDPIPLPDINPNAPPINVTKPISPDKLLKTKQEISAVRDALTELDDEDRAIVVLKHWGDLRFKDIAARLGIPVNTAKTRFYRALKKLGEKLELKGIGQ